MQTYKLGEIAEYINGRAFKSTEREDKGSPIIRIQNLNDENASFNFSTQKFDERYLVKKGDLLFARSGSLGTFIWNREDGWLNQHIFKVIPNEDIADKKFFYFVLISLINKFESKTHGATMVHITRPEFINTEIPLPSLSTQHAIAEKLDKLQSLIDLKKQAIAKTDDLAKAIFLEMFGDPMVNEKGWEMRKLGDIIERLDAGKSLAGDEECVNKVLNTGSVSYDFFAGLDYKNLPPNYTPLLNHKVNIGDLIISRMNTEELVGAAGYVFNIEDNVYIPDRLRKIIVRDNLVDKIFLWKMITNNVFKDKIRKIASGTSGSMKNISKERFLQLNVPFPPFTLQQKFADIIIEIEAQKSEHKLALMKLEDLYQAEMQKSFSL